MLDEPNDARTAVARANQRIKTLHDNGSHKEALALAEHTVSRAIEELGDTHPLTMVSLGNLAVELKWTGHLQDAKNVHEKLLKLHQATGTERTESYAKTLNNLAELYVDDGDDTTAEALHVQALTLLESILPPNEQPIADSLSNLAQIFGRKGRFVEAERFLRRALDIDQHTVGTHHFVYAMHLGNLAAALHGSGQHAESMRSLRQALEIINASVGQTHHLFADTLCKVASIYRTVGDFKEAQRLYEQALKTQYTTLGKTVRVAGTLDLLASLYAEMGKRREAEGALAQAQQIRAESGQRDDRISSLAKRARLSSQMGDLGAAESLFRQVLQREEAMGENHPPLAATLNNLAEVLKNKGDVAEAEALYQRALAIQVATSGADHPNHATIQHNLAMLYAATDRPREALTLMTKAEAIGEQQLGQIFSTTSERQRLDYLGDVTDRATCLLSLVTQHFPLDRDAVRIAFDLVLRRKGITAEALASQRSAILLGRYPAVESKLRELSELKQRIAEGAWASPGTQDWAAQQHRLEDLRSQAERREMEVAQEVADTDIATILQAINTDALANALPANAVLVEFAQCDTIDFRFRPTQTQSARGPTHYIAFVLPAKQPEDLQMFDLGDTWPIDQRIAKFRSFLADTSAETEQDRSQPPAWPTGDPGRDVGDELRRMLLDPLYDAIRHHRGLFVAPSGDLTRLPFQVLPLGDKHYLTDAFNIGYLSAGRDAIRLAKPTERQPNGAIVIADPNFSLATPTAPLNRSVSPLRTALTFWRRGSKQRSHQQPARGLARATSTTTPPAHESEDARPAGRHSRDLLNRNLRFSPLPGTRLEGERVAALLGVEPWLGDAALKSRVRRCRSPRVLHLATHGFFLADQVQNADIRPNPHETHHTTGDAAGAPQGPGMESPLLRSGLALAGANTWLARAPLPPDAENGLLTAEEMSGLDLSSTELITVSDCDTGLGELHGSEGVFGLRRSCLIAGARTLVMSLWKLPDLATAILMVSFYENLREGFGRSDALQLAQDQLRRTTIGELRADWLRPEMIEALAGGDERQRRYLKEYTAQRDDARPFEHPNFWAAFICEGDHRPLPWYAETISPRERTPDFVWEKPVARAAADTKLLRPATPAFRLLNPVHLFMLPNGVSAEMGLVVSPDSRHVAYAVRDTHGMHVEVDGRPLRRYDHVFGLELANTTLAYGAARAGRIFVVVDEQEHDVWDDIGRSSPVTSPDGCRVAYSARRGNWWYVIVDGVVVGGPYEGLGPGGVLFSHNSRRYAYVVKQGPDWLVVVDGVEQPTFPSIAERCLSFSPDSAKLAYVASVRGHRSSTAFVGEAATVINGVIGRTWRVDESTRQNGLSGELYFSPDSTHLAYSGLENGKSFVAVDDEVDRHYDGLLSGRKTRSDGKPLLHHRERMGTIAFSPDSQRVAYAAQRGNQAVAVLLDRTPQRFPHDRILNQPLLLSPDSQHVAYGVEQHLEQGVAIDGRVRWAYSGLPPTPWSFSPDAAIIAYVTWNGTGRHHSLGFNGAHLDVSGGLVANSSLLWDDNENLHCLVGDGQRIWTQSIVAEGGSPCAL